MCVCLGVVLKLGREDFGGRELRVQRKLKQERRGKRVLPQLASFEGIKVPFLLPFLSSCLVLGLFMDFQVGMLSYGLDLKL